MAERSNPDSDLDTGKRFREFLAGCPAEERREGDEVVPTIHFRLGIAEAP